jgi:epoxide hydrolase-like predicted phosphatase
MIKYVIFDMGGVIKMQSASPGMSPTKLSFHKLAGYAGVDPEKMLEFIKSAEISVTNGKMSEKEFFDQMKKKLAIKHSSRQLRITVEKYFSEMSRLNRGVVSILKSVKKNYIVGLVTDVYPMHVRSNRKDNIYDHFKYVVTSLEAGQTKAEGSRAFRMILKKMKALPDECVFIDDKEKNLAFAGKLGMKTIHFKNARQLRSELIRLDVRL